MENTRKRNEILNILCACFALALVSCGGLETSLDREDISSSLVEVSSSAASVSEWCDAPGNCGTFTDIRDSRVYKWTKIGAQTWMAENLAYLPSVNAMSDNSNSIAKYYVYDFDDTTVSRAKASRNYSTYGVLYNWIAANTACPGGWHLSKMEEWNTLVNYVGGTDVAGEKLKANGTMWSNNAGIDAFGFFALPGGYYTEKDFEQALFLGLWWTAYGPEKLYAVYMSMAIHNSMVYSYFDFWSYGLSVRCILD